MPEWRTYESSTRLIAAIIAAHPELKLNYREIAKAYGGDCTTSAIENRFRNIRVDSKRIRDILKSDGDPITYELTSLRHGKGGGGEISKYYGDSSLSSLEHRFRPIKKEAKAMRAGIAIADKFGEQTTAKAISTRFERYKKEPHWNLTNTMSENGGVGKGPATALGAGGGGGGAGAVTDNGGAPKTPRKPKAGRKGKAKKETDDSEIDDDELDGIIMTGGSGNSAFKKEKGTLRKTVGGRVQKTPSKRSASKAVSYVESDVDEDDDIDIQDGEYITDSGAAKNGNGYGHIKQEVGAYGKGNGFVGHQEMEDDEEEYEDAMQQLQNDQFDMYSNQI